MCLSVGVHTQVCVRVLRVRMSAWVCVCVHVCTHLCVLCLGRASPPSPTPGEEAFLRENTNVLLFQGFNLSKFILNIKMLKDQLWESLQVGSKCHRENFPPLSRTQSSSTLRAIVHQKNTHRAVTNTPSVIYRCTNRAGRTPRDLQKTEAGVSESDPLPMRTGLTVNERTA